MPKSSMVIDGTMSEVSNDFQDILQELHEETTNQSSASEEQQKQKTNSRWNEDGTYTSKPLDKHVFQKIL